MRQTTVLIRSTIEENNRVRVYWRWAVSSKSWSRARGFRAFSRVARTMTQTGASRANCSKTSSQSMVVGLLLMDAFRGGWPVDNYLQDGCNRGGPSPLTAI